MICVSCGASEEILRPLEKSGVALTRCVACDAETRRPEVVSSIDICSPYVDRTLAELGIPDGQVISLAGDTIRRYLQLGLMPQLS